MPKYVYPAVFTTEDEGGYSIEFPDIEGCYTQGDDLVEGIIMAEDVLALMLCCREKEGLEIPPATPMEHLQVPENSFATLILCDTTDYPLTEAADDEQHQETA